MNKTALALVFCVLLSILGAIGDYFLKVASLKSHPLLTASFLTGLLVYGCTMVGWVYIMQHLRLGIIGGVYSVSTVLLCVLLGHIFGERLVPREWIGIALAGVSLLLLTRFP